MGGAIGQMLSSAVGVAVSPLPLIVLILMLSTSRGRANGIAFALGWMIALAVVGTVVLLAGGSGASSGGKPASWTNWLHLAVGVLFVAMAARQWKDRPRPGREAEPPKWMASIDQFTPVKAAGIAALLAGPNPKNLALTVAGATGIASSGASGASQTVALVLFVVIASLCVLIPLGVYLLGGEKAAATLDGWKTWMSEHNAAIMTTVLIVLGAKYIGDALVGLAA